MLYDMNDDSAYKTYTSKWGRKSFIQPLWEPTPFTIIRKMLVLTNVRPGDIVYDLGCGDARILIMAIQEFGAKKAVGYEVNPYLYGQALQDVQRNNLQYKVTLIEDDLINADISEASVITLFLSINANECLKPKLEKEAKPLTRVVSFFHPIEAWQVSKTRGPQEDMLYLYVLPHAFQSMHHK
ncbi:50S ribosomal protein L11 methyltransferase [Chloroflexota bacterium]